MKNIRNSSTSLKKYRYLVFLTSLGFFFAGCLSENPQNSSITTQIEQSLKTKLEDALPEVNPELRSTATYLDLENGYEYSNENGLQKIETGHEDAKGIIRFSNGSFLRKNSPTIRESSNIQPRANFEYLRSVKSIAGYNGIYREITPPSSNPLWFTGINEAGEAGYNYFGVKSSQPVCIPDPYKNPPCPPGSIPQSQSYDVEGGIFTSAGPNYIQGRYLFYMSNNGSYSILRWPTYDGYSGSTVRMSLRVIQDNKVQLTVFPVQESTSQAWIVDAIGAKASGVGAQVRKNTSLLVNELNARFWDSSWKFVRLYQNSSASQVAFSPSLASSTVGSCYTSCFPYEQEIIRLP
jgi:hypothetical protein